MRSVSTIISDLVILEPKVFGDERGFFFESFNARRFTEMTGVDAEFVQDNHSKSAKGVLRGLHYQIEQPQGKLVRVVAGEVFDVAVDIRRSSPTFGKWSGANLSAVNRLHRWIPIGFAHGFVVLGESAEVLYKTTDYWAPQHERTILWNDPSIGIDWPFAGEPTISVRDKDGKLMADAEVFP
jgi:dTDP-4-dehydrorhamnose 3,5-epimerase